MKNQKENQPVIAHQIKGDCIAQGPAGHHSAPEVDATGGWRDGNGY